MSEEEARRLYTNLGLPVPADLAAPAAAKFRNVKKEVDGVVFDSSLEARAYRVLGAWERTGRARDVARQQPYLLQDGFRTAAGKRVRPIVYRLDFVFWDVLLSRRRYVDVKGFQTEVFRLKAKMLAARYPGLELELWTKSYVRDLERAG